MFQDRISHNISRININISIEQMKYFLRLDNINDKYAIQIIQINQNSNLLKEIQDISELKLIDQAAACILNNTSAQFPYFQSDFKNGFAMEAFTRYQYNINPSKTVLYNFSEPIEIHLNNAYPNSYGNQRVLSDLSHLFNVSKIAFLDPNVQNFVTPILVTANQDPWPEGLSHWITVAINRKQISVIDSTNRIYPSLAKEISSLLMIDNYESIQTKQQGKNDLCGYFTMFYIENILKANNIQLGLNRATSELLGNHQQIEQIIRKKKQKQIDDIIRLDSDKFNEHMLKKELEAR